MKEKRLKLVAEILAILVVCLVSFVGVYGQNTNKIVNLVKGYDLSKDLKGYRELVFKVSDATEVLDSTGKYIGDTDIITDSSIERASYQKTENKVNSDESLTLENYKKSKTIIEERLKSLNVQDYNISMDTSNGTITLQIPEDEDTEHTISNILQVAKFEIRDSEDNSKVYITNDGIKKLSALYNTTNEGTTVYLQMEFNKDAANKLKELSTGEYVTKESKDDEEDTENTTEEDTTDENAVEEEVNMTSDEESSENNSEVTTETEDSEESETEEEQKKIVIAIDTNEMITTSFDEPINDGIIDLSMNQPSNEADKISDTLRSASTISLLVNSGNMPLTYKITSNNYVKTDITQDALQKTLIVIDLVVVIGLVLFIIKYKLRGLIACIAYIGFMAMDLLIIRYTNTQISIESLVAAIIILAINYTLTFRVLKIQEQDKEKRKLLYNSEAKSWIIKLLPVFIISIIFVFIKWAKIATFGMFMFWGILLSVIYTYLLTRDMLDK